MARPLGTTRRNAPTAGEASSVAKPDHVAERVRPRTLRREPDRRLDRAAREDRAIGRAMRELEALALACERDRVLADDVARTRDREPDRFGARARRIRAIALGHVVERDAARVGDRTTERERGTRRRILLVAVMGFG